MAAESGAGAGAGAGAAAAVALDEATTKLFAHVDANVDTYVERLAECVAFRGVSADPAQRGEVVRTVEWAADWIRRLGGTVELRDLGKQTLGDGTQIPLPPAIFASVGNDASKPTLFVYGHLDVQPAEPEGWNTDPWVLTNVDGALYGRGSTDDKGPVLGWLWVLEAHQKLGLDMPVNLKLCLEGMEESGSIGLEEAIDAEIAKGDASFFAGVDACCISDNYWLGTRKPCITYGLRGIVTFRLEVTASTKDLHSGVHGGVIHEAVFDVMKVMSSLLNNDGTIAVDGIYKEVAPMTDAERASLDAVDFDVDAYRGDVGVSGALNFSSKFDVLTHRWRIPSLSLHGIEHAYSGPGDKTVIPRRATGKFSVRLVPDMDPDRTVAAVRAHVEAKFKEIGSPNAYKLSVGHAAPAWVADFNHPNFVAGRNASKNVHGVEPDLTREGGSIPITLKFEEATQRNVMLLPVGRSDDGAHSQNEKLDLSNYINGIKLLGSYVHELAKALKAAEGAKAE